MNTSPSLKDTLTAQFGTDEALGVWFRTDDGEALSLAEYDAMFARLGDDDMPGTESLLPDGSSAVCCTDYAAHVFKALPGRVRIVGFANEENPDCQVVLDELHPGGHDFAIVDNRYLVDPWCKLVRCCDWQPVYDRQLPEDNDLVLKRYGPDVCWTPLVAAEARARKQMAESARETVTA